MSTRNASRSERPPRRALISLPTLAPETTVHVAGRVVDVDEEAFSLQDESGLTRVHAAQVPGPGRLCRVRGRWTGSALEAYSVEELGGGEQVFRHGSDYRRLREAGRGLTWLRQRARLLGAVRQFFDEREYLEVETPLAVPSPGLDLHLTAFEVRGGPSTRWLITSPEYQMKRLLSAGAERIYQVCRCFRRDEQGALHESEFSMLEWYRAYSEFDDMLEETEALVRTVAQASPAGLNWSFRDTRVDLSKPFERLQVREAFRRYADADADALDDEHFYRVLTEQVEPRLGCERPTFLTHYPARMASLAQLCPHDPSVAERFELYVAGVELCNGFSELTCPHEQRRRLQADVDNRRDAGLEVYPVDERFLSALEDGMPPSTGNALGLDRLFMLALGAPDIQALLAIPGDVL